MHKVIGWVADKLLTNKKIDIFLSSAHLKAISFPPFHLVSSWGDNAWCCNSWTQTNQDINLEDDVHQEMYICLAWNWKNIKNPSYIFVLKIPNWLGSRRFNQSCLEIPPWRETNHQLHRKSANSYEFSNTHHPSSPWCGLVAISFFLVTNSGKILTHWSQKCEDLCHKNRPWPHIPGIWTEAVPCSEDNARFLLVRGVFFLQ